MRLRSRLRRRIAMADGGFTLVEMMTAMFIIMVVLLALVGVYTSSVRTLGLAKQRQQATSLANRAMEQLRALPYDTVAAGLRSSDVSPDPNIDSATGHFKPPFDTSIDEVLQTNAGTNQAPLYPHIQHPAAINGVSYTVSTYVTQVAGATPTQYWLTVVVEWSSAATNHAAKRVVTRSRLYSPQGCLSTATHPFSGPCQAFLYATAGTTPGSISIAGLGGAAPVPGIDFQSAQISLAGLSSAAQIEQTTSVNGKATTAAGSITRSSGTTGAGGLAAITAVDTDPGTAGSGTPSASTASQTSGPVTVSGSGGSITVAPTTGDAGSSVSTTAAGVSPACQKPDGTALTGGQICGSGTVQSTGSAGYLSMDFASMASRDLPAFSLATVSAAPASTNTFVARYTTPGTSYCPAASGVGCVAAAASRSLGDLTLGGLPSPDLTRDTFPSGFTNVLSLSDYSDAVAAESGIGAATHPAPTVAGTLQYWNGTGYTSVSLASPPASISVPDVSATYKLNDGTTAVFTIQTTVSLGTAVDSSSGTSPCADSCVVEQSVTSPVVVTMVYTVTHSGNGVAAFRVAMNLGTLDAHATYKAAPSA